jgi:hypothetical protein
MALVVCFAQKGSLSAATKGSSTLSAFGQPDAACGSIRLAGGLQIDRQVSLPGQFSGLLETRREGPLAVGY